MFHLYAKMSNKVIIHVKKLFCLVKTHFLPGVNNLSFSCWEQWPQIWRCWCSYHYIALSCKLSPVSSVRHRLMVLFGPHHLQKSCAILSQPIWIPSAWLCLDILSIKIRNRTGPCKSQHLPKTDLTKGRSVQVVLSTWTKLSLWVYKD